MLDEKRGQATRSNAALVVLLIGLVLILYILFLPPAQREELLSGTNGPGGPGVATGGPIPGSQTLMAKYVGTLRANSDAEIEHKLPSTTVFTAINTQEVKLIDSMLIKRGAFSNEPTEMTFRADPQVAANHLLTFNVEEAKGPLRLYLNDILIFERVITSRSPEPIRLPNEYIEGENVLRFETTSTGWAFWSANKYLLRNILITADVKDYQGATAEQSFTITPDEYEKLEKGVLEFIPKCDARDTGRLSIHINQQALYSGFIDCGVQAEQDVAKEFLSIGANTIAFTSHEGSYAIERIQLVSILGEENYPVLYFNLPPDLFQATNAFAGQLLITVRFAEGNKEKRGSIIINGFQDGFQTTNYYYQASIDAGVLIPNANSVQIIPEGSSLDVAEVRVELI